MFVFQDFELSMEKIEMKRSVCSAAGLSLLLIACNPASREQATARTPQFENEYVEVWKSVIVPNQPLSMHSTTTHGLSSSLHSG